MEKEKKKTDWKRVLRNCFFMIGLLWKACPKVVVLDAFCCIFFAFWNNANIFLYKYALNAVQEQYPLTSILMALGIYVGLTVTAEVLGYIRWDYRERKTPIADAYIQRVLQRKAADIDLMCFDDPAFFDCYVKATGSATDKAFNVEQCLFYAVSCIVGLLCLGGLIVSIDPVFIPIACLPLLCTVIIGGKSNRVNYECDMRNREVERKTDYVRRVFYQADFAKEMRLTAMWKVMFKRMRDSVAEMKDIVRRYGYKKMFFSCLTWFVFHIITYIGSVTLAVFRTLVLKNMPIGDCFVVINSISTLASSLERVGQIFLNLDSESLYIENLRAFLDYEIKIAEDKNAPEVSSFESLTLKNVSFCYKDKGTRALSDVSFTVKAGERIAIVGHNGAGKSTLVKVLLRLYDPSEGTVLVNGRDIKSVRLSSYRRLFGTVFQDYRLFAVTVAENVMMRGDLTDEDKVAARQALEKAGVWDKIAALPKGVDTNVTKEFDGEGVVFSGGEAQKISIARLFAGGQEIVIMDEPTSALDPIAEQEMYKNMFDACEGKTVIFISHRLSSATMADRIYLFENGRIAEQGTHGALLALNGKYADSWHKQADAYTAKEAEI